MEDEEDQEEHCVRKNASLAVDPVDILSLSFCIHLINPGPMKSTSVLSHKDCTEVSRM